MTFTSYADAIISGMPLPDDIALLHGENASPYDVLRSSTPLEQLRANGTFFTGQAMAERLWGDALTTLADGDVVVDPACGAGDLLLPAARGNGGSTITFRACDVRADFTEIAAARIASTGQTGLNRRIETRVADFTVDQSSVSDAAIVVLNPPFVSMNVDESWASGSVNSAAWFTLHAIRAMPKGSRLLAVLPDVLRSGSRYERWRQEIAAETSAIDIQLMGQFDDRTDVDVFRLELVVGADGEHGDWRMPAPAKVSVGDHFEVRVGPVVPHRDPESGAVVEFITARSLSSGSTLARAFSGRLETGPMVLIGRTSRPGQDPRVRAVYRSSVVPAAIENHLLIAKPKDGLESTCLDLLEVLGSASTVDFLDNRIRCRHLTVRAVKEIPWFEIPRI